MSDAALSYLTSEARARVQIDRMLELAGWIVQSANQANLNAGRGVAVREFVMEPPHGRVDYLLFVDRVAVGVIEAKKEGETLTGVEWQSAKYLDGLPSWVDAALEGFLPFAYESTGVETRFTSTLDPEPRSREVFWFHRPERNPPWDSAISYSRPITELSLESTGSPDIFVTIAPLQDAKIPSMPSPVTGRCFSPPSPAAALGGLIQSPVRPPTFRPVDQLTGPNPAELSPNQPVFEDRP
jgi:Type I restriction enzyme R protein N terminus (HSDR_N)